MFDTTINISNSKIQHGPKNNRIYLMHLQKEDMPKILDDLDSLANFYGYSKIFAKVPKASAKTFFEYGYISEAKISRFFNGTEDCIFMAKYMDNKRNTEIDKDLNRKVLDVALSKKLENSFKNNSVDYNLPKEFSFKKAKPSDASKMAALYSKVFNSYPFPVSDPQYIKETMNDNVIYFGVWKGNDIVALSSCEMCLEDKNVEMTDFAVVPDYRGHKFAYFLLGEMEKEMRKREIKTAYTIARSTSYGMNSTFAKCGYSFKGRLIKNTQIGGDIEDMNVWSKVL
ncbi:putative beta-lysine N-acetyltransferase [Clostridium sporogenes]|uniref:putative beta-lysine N-acetyltransferase n=1 Tax=Clostridium sporogenes TaxID=1509 RepID=UPI00024BA335|nr:putative beta-lysine N-acetyltransferase [Clostridium sporogenes]EHN16347.1 GCN5-related N-acetyltransferase [Clostridium sporogenes PA 3679]MCW6107601.1 putative beta-lysine N-acetyltransferase [Clostridium sporogenes]NFQ36696.1 putative beta-lysine N-acetyltransferase [Clostridium sporogenes]NFQ62309.1 putative beta-lysine N-acetyltransferase [Clostridium sporogenes]NFU09478.1 putative beta-lysine N-acetyltransferase [Clostridium sporogenes]